MAWHGMAWHGKEFYLTLFMHEQLRNRRGDEIIAPYMQTTSTCNHVIERMWVELNHRVTYPVKQIVTSMENNHTINMSMSMSMSMSCPITQFCVSIILCRVCEVGMRRMILAWNSHPIPRRGIPNTLQTQAFNTVHIHPLEVPQCSAAVKYRRQGGRLTDPSSPGNDPLESEDLCAERETRWYTQCGSVENILSNMISGNTQILEDAIIKCSELTH